MEHQGWQVRERAAVSAPNHVINQIREALLSKVLHPGDRIPPEPELAELCGVSRGSVRQAMKALETLGVLSIRPGDGTYVNTAVSRQPLSAPAFFLMISSPSLKELSDTRYALECDMLELILSDPGLTSSLIPDLEENVARHRVLLAREADARTLAENDLRFHRILSHSCGNTLIRIVYDYVMDFFFRRLADPAGISSGEEAVRAHSMLVDALRGGAYATVKDAVREAVRIWYSAAKNG